MIIRPYKAEDLEAIKKLQDNPGYEMPPIDDALTIIHQVLADEDDRPRMAVFGRVYLNAVLFVDHSFATPAERLECLTLLQNAALAEAREKGFDMITTQVEGRFAERIQQIGWKRAWGDLYFRSAQ